MTDRVLRIVSLGAIIWLLVVAIPATAALRSAAADRPPNATARPIARAFILPTRTSRPTATRGVLATEVPTLAATPAGASPEQAPDPSPTPSPLLVWATPTAQTSPADLASGDRPTRIRIPAIEVDAAVEPIGLTADREMDVPDGWESVGWYRHSPQPGQVGNAVLAGHLDTNTGAPGVFWRLGELQAGDLILIDAEDGASLVFQISSLVRYPYAEAPREVIFGPAQTARLNLITCSGVWNPQDRLYDHRLVVYADLIQDGGLVDSEITN